MFLVWQCTTGRRGRRPLQTRIEVFRHAEGIPRLRGEFPLFNSEEKPGRRCASGCVSVRGRKAGFAGRFVRQGNGLRRARHFRQGWNANIPAGGQTRLQVEREGEGAVFCGPVIRCRITRWWFSARIRCCRGAQYKAPMVPSCRGRPYRLQRFAFLADKAHFKF